MDFNTSNVTIQPNMRESATCTRIISIHLMLLFNYLINSSTSVMFADFNTSNVTIQRIGAAFNKDVHLFQYI